jgi:hypothetical protein
VADLKHGQAPAVINAKEKAIPRMIGERRKTRCGEPKGSNQAETRGRCFSLMLTRHRLARSSE